MKLHELVDTSIPRYNPRQLPPYSGWKPAHNFLAPNEVAVTTREGTKIITLVDPRVTTVGKYKDVDAHLGACGGE